MSRILACLDASPYAQSVCELAAWAAHRLSASVDLLHVVQRKSAVPTRNDLTGAIGLGVKSELLEELTQMEEMESRVAIQAGRLLLQAVSDKLRQAGIDNVTPVHRHGGIVETILELEKDSRLLIMGKRGASAQFARAHLGSKIERVVRASKKPILIAPLDVQDIKQLVIAYDGSPSAGQALELGLTSPLFQGLDRHVIVAGDDTARHRNEVDKARHRIAESGHTATVSLITGAPETVIPEYMARTPDSMLAMGAYGHSPLRNLIVGSTTTAMIRTVNQPILLIR